MESLLSQMNESRKLIERQTAGDIRENRRMINKVWSYDIFKALEEFDSTLNDEQKNIILSHAMDKSLYCERDNVQEIAMDYAEFYKQLRDVETKPVAKRVKKLFG